MRYLLFIITIIAFTTGGLFSEGIPRWMVTDKILNAGDEIKEGYKDVDMTKILKGFTVMSEGPMKQVRDRAYRPVSKASIRYMADTYKGWRLPAYWTHNHDRYKHVIGWWMNFRVETMGGELVLAADFVPSKWFLDSKFYKKILYHYYKSPDTWALSVTMLRPVIGHRIQLITIDFVSCGNATGGFFNTGNQSKCPPTDWTGLDKYKDILYKLKR